MTLYLQLIQEHRRGDLSLGDRPISIAVLRASYPEVGWRRWKDWRDRAGCPKAAQRISKLSALKLWLLAGTNGNATDEQIVSTIGNLAQNKPKQLEKWLKRMSWRVNGASCMMKTINIMAPGVDVIHRQRLYEWWGKAGLSYSARKTYSHAQIARAVSVASEGIGKGRHRQLSFF